MKRLLLALLLLATVTACTKLPMANTEGILSQRKTALKEGEQWVTVELCFLSSDIANRDTLMEQETRQIKLDPSKSLEWLVVEELLKGPSTAKAQNIVPKGCRVLNIEKKEGTLLIVLSPEGKELSLVDEVMLKNMIVLTMTKLSDINRVGVYFGQIQRDSKNNPIGVISAKDIVSEDITSKVGQKTITAYLPNQDKSALLVREINIQTSINETVEKTVVEELFKNTAYEGFSQTVFNPNAKLVSSFVEGDTFFLNFSEPIIKEQASYEEAYLSVYALINTISDLQPIKNIQILIKGKTNTESAHGMLFRAPYLTKNEEIIIQQ